MTIEQFRSMLAEHRLIDIRRIPPVPSTLKCACGMPVNSVDAWTRHVAEAMHELWQDK